nr:glucose-induced degradation protein 8 homolog [Ipomoea trifida]
MNFLVTEGYVEAAEKFRIESGTEPDIDLATITDRMAVKKAVQSGNIEDAIEKVNDLNPEILDTNPQLFFHLQQQRLIELIRHHKVEEALEFAHEELAPRGEENYGFLDELERTMTLLAFEDVENCPLGELVDMSQRLKTASEVNAAILTSQSHEKDPKLPSLLKMLIWAQNELDEKLAYPRIKIVSTAALEDPDVEEEEKSNIFLGFHPQYTDQCGNSSCNLGTILSFTRIMAAVVAKHCILCPLIISHPIIKVERITGRVILEFRLPSAPAIDRLLHSRSHPP